MWCCLGDSMINCIRQCNRDKECKSTVHDGKSCLLFHTELNNMDGSKQGVKDLFYSVKACISAVSIHHVSFYW